MSVRLLLPLAVLLLLAPTSAATLELYHSSATEHDDLGRSEEPDSRQTSVLGPLLAGCVLSFDPLRLPGRGRACVPDTAVAPGSIAPGCTDDAGRQPSGLCGAWTLGVALGGQAAVAPGTVGTRGMSGSAAPGTYTPSKATAIRFLDLQVAVLPPAGPHVELNRKFTDLGVRSAASVLDPSFGDALLAPTSGLWAWYGVWRDANGNGVIDHLDAGSGTARGDNEFRWVGGCGDLSSALCLAEPGLRLPVWIWPGDHHQGCGFLIGCYPPADLPGREAVCLAVSSDGELRNLLWCPPERTEAADPLLGGAQEGVAADGALLDHTHQVDPRQRFWRYGLPPMYLYDQSLVVTTVFAGGPTQEERDPRFPQGWDLAALQFVDVDRHDAWTPLLGTLVQSELKPAVQTPWVAVRDLAGPTQAFVDARANAAAVDGPTQAAAPAEDRLRDPGWSREPNHPSDAFPAAPYRVHLPSLELPVDEQAHRGWLNDYAAHGGTWRAFADVRARRIDFVYGNGCHQPCSPSGGFGYRDSFSVLPRPGVAVRAEGDHTRTLDPGLYMFDGHAGAWRDLPHAMVERVLEPLETLATAAPAVREEKYLLPADGWVGNLVNTTGTWRYRGYGEASCTIAGALGTRAWALCHPYLDADTASAAGATADGADQSFGLDLSDPQDWRDRTEFEPLPGDAPLPPLTLRPSGGMWTAPAFVWRDFYTWQYGDVAALEDWTGRAGPLSLRTIRLHDRVISADVLVLPLGALGLDLATEFRLRVDFDLPGRGLAVHESVADVDAYAGWGA